MGKSLKSAGNVDGRASKPQAGACSRTSRNWPTEYQAEANEIRKDVRTALESDEHAVSLAPFCRTCQTQAMRLLAQAAKAKSTEADRLTKPDKSRSEASRAGR